MCFVCICFDIYMVWKFVVCIGCWNFLYWVEHFLKCSIYVFCMHLLWYLHVLEICCMYWMLKFLILSWTFFFKCSMGRSKTAISSFIFNGLISGVVALRFWLNNANIKVNPTNWLAAYVLHNLLAYFQNWIRHKIAQSMSQTHKVPTMIPTFLWFCRSFVIKPQTHSKQ